MEWPALGSPPLLAQSPAGLPIRNVLEQVSSSSEVGEILALLRNSFVLLPLSLQISHPISNITSVKQDLSTQVSLRKRCKTSGGSSSFCLSKSLKLVNYNRRRLLWLSMPSMSVRAKEMWS